MPELIEITDRRDPCVAAFTSIRERDLGRQDGRFIVEGKVALRTLFERSAFAPESVFILSSRLQSDPGLLNGAPAGINVFHASREVMSDVAGFPIHRGVLACALKGPARDPAALLARSNTVLLLAHLSNHDNVGAAFRNAAAFGADAVLLDETCCDPLYRKSIRVSSGAALWLPFSHGLAGIEMARQAKAADFEVWAMTPRETAEDLYSLRRPDRLAILLGAEGPGLPDELIDAARPVRIPMRPGFDSVNVATAGAIALSHALRGG